MIKSEVMNIFKITYTKAGKYQKCSNLCSIFQLDVSCIDTYILLRRNAPGEKHML